MTDNDLFSNPTPTPQRHPDATRPLPERLGYLVYVWDALVAGPRTKDWYLALGDDLAREVERTS